MRQPLASFSFTSFLELLQHNFLHIVLKTFKFSIRGVCAVPEFQNPKKMSLSFPRGSQSNNAGKGPMGRL